MSQLKRRRSFETLADKSQNVRTDPNDQNRKIAVPEFEKKRTGSAQVLGTAAADPAFEKQALGFEKRFGAAAMGNGQVQGAVQGMCDRVVQIITAHWQTTRSKEELKLSEAVGEDCSTTLKHVAGAVSEDKVLEHMLDGGGNVRTKMTALFNFGHAFQGKLTELSRNNKMDEFVAKLNADNPSGDTIEMEKRGKALAEGTSRRLTPNPTTGAVAGQANSRGKHENKATHKSIRTGAQVGATQDELDFMEIGANDKVSWEEGARVWVINENDAWVEEIRKLSLPLKAGPSGTTDRIMQTGGILGVTSPVDTRAACLGYLLPINAHSMVEIMAAAANHGVPFTEGPGMYESVDPFGSLEAYSPNPEFWAQVTGVEVGEEAMEGEL